jgi:hypothetical protein
MIHRPFCKLLLLVTLYPTLPSQAWCAANYDAAFRTCILTQLDPSSPVIKLLQKNLGEGIDHRLTLASLCRSVTVTFLGYK